MLKIEKNKDGDIFVSGDSADLRDLRYQIDEVLDHQMSFTKGYHDFKWNAWEAKERSMNVTVSLK